MSALKYLFVFLIYFLSIFDLHSKNTTENYDVVYVINLDRSPDRLEKISKQLKDAGIKFKRFKAIDGRDLKITNIKTGKIENTVDFISDKPLDLENNLEYLVSSKDFSIKYRTNKKFFENCLSYGELGCAMSHLAVMHDIVKNNFKTSIVLEDDVILKKNFKDEINLIITNTPADFDILYISPGINRSESDLEVPLNERIYIANPERLLQNFNQIPNNEHIVKISKNNILYGTHAYCISLKGAQKIIKNSDVITEAIDNQLFHEKISLYAARKNILSISDTPSIIFEMGRSHYITKNKTINKGEPHKLNLNRIIFLLKKAHNFFVTSILDFFRKKTETKHNGNDKANEVPYDAIYVINLDRTPERFKNIEKQLKEYDLNTTRFSAVDGLDITLINKKNGERISGKDSMRNVKKYISANSDLYHVEYAGKYKDAEFDLTTQYKFSAGEIGVTFSHRAIWADIVKNKYKRVVVFEDDAILLKNFKTSLFNLLNNIPQDSDITFIGVGIRKYESYFYPDVDKIFRDFDHVPNNDFVAKIQPTNLAYGMFAYIIGESGAKKLLEMTNTVGCPIDDIVFQCGGINSGKINGYTAKKRICSVSFSNSEIKKMGRKH